MILADCPVLFAAPTKLFTKVDDDIAGTLNTVDEDTMDDKGGNERSITSSRVSPFAFPSSTFLSVLMLFKMKNDCDVCHTATINSNYFT